ncbi:MAG: trypsin-like peptidase domain-containing protein [Cyanobacteriota bacterium]
MLQFSDSLQASLASYEDSIKILKKLTTQDPFYAKNLLYSMVNSSDLYLRLGRKSQSLLRAEEALKMARELEIPKADAPDLSASTSLIDAYIYTMRTAGWAQFNAGEPEKARATLEEVFSILQPIAARKSSFQRKLLEVRNTLDEINRKDGIDTGSKRILSPTDLRYLPSSDPITPIKRSVVLLWPEFSGNNSGIGSLGTGFVIRRQGDRAWIATALHVLRNPDDYRMAAKVEAELFTGPLPPGLVAPRIEVVLPKNPLQIKGGDDLIILEIRGLPPDVKPLPLATSAAEGELMIIVGHPTDSDPWTVGRFPLRKAGPTLVLDGRLTEGASGSPVLTPAGHVVGIVFRSSGEGEPVPFVYAFPAHLIQGILP